MKKFSERLRELRMENNLSIRELARKLNFDASTVSRWENNKLEIRISQAVLIAKFFGVSLDYMAGLED